MKRRWLLLLGAFCVQAALAQDPQPGNALQLLIGTLAKIEAPEAQANILRGLNASLKGQRDVPAPPGWAELYKKLKTSPNEAVRQQAQTLAATFGGGAALDEFRKTFANPAAPLPAREGALQSLVEAKDARTMPLLLELTQKPDPLRGAALRALATFEDERVAGAIIGGFSSFNSAEKRDALNTLLTRAATARALLTAIDENRIDRAEITAPLARQLQSLKHAEVETWLAKNWGAVRGTSEDKQKEIAKFKEFLTPELIARADPAHGRAIFAQLCSVCHMLHGTGGKIGPELPGSYADIDYLLQNILDPNALIGRDYQQSFLELKDGRVLSGIVASEDTGAVTLKTLGDPITVQRAEIQALQVSPQSMMPEGLLVALDEEGVRALFAYLRQLRQVPMLVTATNVNDFFNGADLSRWHASSADTWKVTAGELIGSGRANITESLTSDMLARDFKLTAKIKVSGENAAGEIALRGDPRALPWTGSSLSLGGTSPANLWKYQPAGAPQSVPGAVKLNAADWNTLEVTARGAMLKVTLNGEPAFTLEDAPGDARTVLAFHLRGAAAELRVKELKLELAP